MKARVPRSVRLTPRWRGGPASRTRRNPARVFRRTRCSSGGRSASVNRGRPRRDPAPARFVRLFIGLRAPRNHRIGLARRRCGRGGRPRRSPGSGRVTRSFADPLSLRMGAFASTPAPGTRLPGAPGRHVLRGRGHPAHSGDPRGPGAPPSRRPNDQARRQRPHLRASGNVGPFAVQIAKSKGAEVPASVGRRSGLRPLARRRSGHATTARRTGRGPERYDWIVDTDSHTLDASSVRKALRPNGVYVTLGGPRCRSSTP
jgi:hypothetical protein